MLDKAGVDPYRDTLTKEQFREKFGTILHPFTASVTATTSFSPMGICSAARAETTVSATMAARSSPSRPPTRWATTW